MKNKIMCEAKGCGEEVDEDEFGIINLCDKHRHHLSGEKLKEAKDVEE